MYKSNIKYAYYATLITIFAEWHSTMVIIMITMKQLDLIRKEKKVSYIKLADDLKMSRSQVTRWFKGETGITLEHLNDVCKIIGVETFIGYGN